MSPCGSGCMTCRRDTAPTGGNHDEVTKRYPEKGRWFRPVLVEAAILVRSFHRILCSGHRRLGHLFREAGQAGRQASQVAPCDPSWPELPAATSFSHPMELVRAAYAFAVRRPDVVQYLPCYCGCEKQGHRSLEFCFVKKRKASGIAEWDGMGFT
ncbi:MAG: hypothetical protein DMG13_16550 [Acidobacteria bacterium]|nr:MAG: hypothetical protein DMG13_16550 [Acidobacteriota bacterium]